MLGQAVGHRQLAAPALDVLPLGGDAFPQLGQGALAQQVLDVVEREAQGLELRHRVEGGALVDAVVAVARLGIHVARLHDTAALVEVERLL